MAKEPVHLKRPFVRLATAGSVDDGKSTLLGRLLLDVGSIYDDHLAALEQASRKHGEGEKLSLALVTDGLRAEREQGITIDVAYRYFSTAKRHFILADSPGHEQYTRNMATGSSTADATIILIDAVRGVLPQTKRHAFIAALMGVPRLIVAINKLDLVGFSEQRFEQIRDDFVLFSAKLGLHEIRFIPVSALHGDNVVGPSENMPWYGGETLLACLEDLYIEGDRNLVDFRFPVQSVLRVGTYRAFAGQIASGTIRPGEEVEVLPSGRRSRVKKIEAWGAQAGLPEASTPSSIAIVLEDEVDIGRGDMIVRPHNVPQLQSRFEAMIVWMQDAPLDPQKEYVIRHTTRETKVRVESIQYRVDVETLARVEAAPLRLNEIGRVQFHAARALALDSYQRNRATGNFILIDPDTFMTAGAGMVIHRAPPVTETSTAPVPDLHPEPEVVTEAERRNRSGFEALTVWLYGLSGSGKSTLAGQLERRLFDQGRSVFRLDGDTLRSGLNRGLGFSREDRKENLRRAAEVARLLNLAGVTVIASFITPSEEDRRMIESIIGETHYRGVYLNTPLEVCERRDPHGLYVKARAGLIPEFTGVSSPFEKPDSEALQIDTSKLSVTEAADCVLDLLFQRKSEL